MTFSTDTNRTMSIAYYMKTGIIVLDNMFFFTNDATIEDLNTILNEN